MPVPVPRTSPLTGLGVTAPVLAAQMAGGPSTAALVTAAAQSGGLGFLAAGYKTAGELARQVAEVRGATPVFGVNLFAPNPLAVDPRGLPPLRRRAAPPRGALRSRAAAVPRGERRSQGGQAGAAAP